MSLNELAASIHQNAADKGFWDKDRNMGEMLMLMTSELAEALEEHREGRPNLWYRHKSDCPSGEGRYPCNCIPKPEGVAVELADCIIRILDTMYSLGVDIDSVVTEKMKYNETRVKMHGKAY